VIYGRAQSIEEASKPFKVGGVESRAAQRTELTRGALEPLGIARGQDKLRSFGSRSARGFESDAGAAPDHKDGLAEEFWFALLGSGGGCGVHDSSNQEDQRGGAECPEEDVAEIFFRTLRSQSLCGEFSGS
jgi:hypothetical protein